MTAPVAARADALEALQAPGKKLSTAGLPDLPAGAFACAAALEAFQALRQECGGTGAPASLPAGSGTADVFVTAARRANLTFGGVEIGGCRSQVDALEALQVFRWGCSRTGRPDPLPASSGATVTAARRTNLTFGGVEIGGCRSHADALEALQVFRRGCSRTGRPDPLPASSGATDALVTDALVTAPRRNITPPTKDAIHRHARRQEAAT